MTPQENLKYSENTLKHKPSMTTPSSDQRIKRKLGRADYTDMDAAFLIAEKTLWGGLRGP